MGFHSNPISTPIHQVRISKEKSMRVVQYGTARLAAVLVG